MAVLGGKFHRCGGRSHVSRSGGILHLAAIAHSGHFDAVALAAVQLDRAGDGGMIVGKALVGAVDGVGIGEVRHFDCFHHGAAVADLKDHLGGQTGDGHAVVIEVGRRGDLHIAVIADGGGEAGGGCQCAGHHELQQRRFRIGNRVRGSGDGLQHIAAHGQGAQIGNDRTHGRSGGGILSVNHLARDLAIAIAVGQTGNGAGLLRPQIDLRAIAQGDDGGLVDGGQRLAGGIVDDLADTDNIGIHAFHGVEGELAGGLIVGQICGGDTFFACATGKQGQTHGRNDHGAEELLHF